jgi:two-component system, NarL family, response regulator LiaR
MCEHRPLRVAIVDDHAMLRMSLATALLAAGDIIVVGAARDGEEALRVCRETKPDVVLMDLQLPVLDGIAAIREIQHFDPVPKVVVLTTLLDERLASQALEAGAVSCLLKSVQAEELIAAIREASTGPSARRGD